MNKIDVYKKKNGLEGFHIIDTFKLENDNVIVSKVKYMKPDNKTNLFKGDSENAVKN